MIEEKLVPDANICEWLKSTGWTAKTAYQWRKYSLQSKPTLFPNDEDMGTKIATLSGSEEWRLPAPTAREIIEQIPQDITITRSEHGWYISIQLAPDQSLFQLKDTLEESLARLWIAKQQFDKL